MYVLPLVVMVCIVSVLNILTAYALFGRKILRNLSHSRKPGASSSKTETSLTMKTSDLKSRETELASSAAKGTDTGYELELEPDKKTRHAWYDF